MKSSGKMCFKILLKVTKKLGFAFSLEDTFFWKTTKGDQIVPPHPPLPSHFKVKLFTNDSFLFLNDTFLCNYAENNNLYSTEKKSSRNKIILLKEF